MFLNGIVIKCAGCGNPLSLEDGKRIVTCECCGNVNIIPSIREDRQADFERAKEFRRAGEFDRAMNLFTDILNDVGDSAELYWEILMSKYGVLFVEDKNLHETVPTVQRMQTTSINTDQDFLMAIKYSTPEEAAIYNNTANYISGIQKKYMDIIKNEKPYDIFISYKESDNEGGRTKDSVLAETLYNDLSKEGYHVFFSRISLEDKIGQEYEPFIYAALNSAKILLLVTTKTEFVEAPWVKNEWKRFLGMMKKDDTKRIIPTYCDINAEDLPEELVMYQAQDLSKIGANQDIIRGIGKLISVHKKADADDVSDKLIDSYLLNAKIALEHSNFSEVEKYATYVVDLDKNNSKGYLYLFFSKNQIKKLKDIRVCGISMAAKEYNLFLVNCQNEDIKQQALYAEAMFYYDNKRFDSAKNTFEKIKDYKDSASLLQETEKIIIKENKRIKFQEKFCIFAFISAVVLPIIAFASILVFNLGATLLGCFLPFIIASLIFAASVAVSFFDDDYAASVCLFLKCFAIHFIVSFIVAIIVDDIFIS